jgi:hypothetical protein
MFDKGGMTKDRESRLSRCWGYFERGQGVEGQNGLGDDFSNPELTKHNDNDA